MKKTAIKRIIPHLVALVVFTLLSCVYFLPQLQNKVVYQSDIISHKQMSEEVRAHEEATGEVSHWTNSMFGGMPTYQISSPVRSNLLQYVEKATNLFFGRPIGYFIALMIGMYILLITLGVNPWLAMIGAIGFGFSSNNLILFVTGHTSKVRAVAFLAPVLAGMIATYRGKYIMGGVLFAVAMGVDLYANHPQMTYYMAMVAVIYVIWQFVEDLKGGNLPHFAKASGILVLGSLLAIGASYSKISSTLEYSKDTMRGAPILATSGEAKSSSETDGLEFGYAMQWSNGVSDLVAGLIPGFVGGGSSEPIVKEGDFSKFLRGQSNAKAPYYWGELPFTSGPAYFGASIFFLFVLGLFLVKGKIKWWLGLGVLFTFLLSMGKNFEFLNRLIFDIFPLYSSFRAPSSVLSVTAVLLPILGFLGVSKLLNGKIEEKQAQRAILISGGIVGGFCLLMALMGGSLFDFTAASDARYAQNPGVAEALQADRASLLQSDSFRSFGIVAIIAGLLFFFVKNKLSQVIMLAGLGLVTVFDLWTVGKRYMNDDSFVSKSTYQNNFKKRPADEQILKDPTLYYRVFDLTVGISSSAQPSFYHKSIGGYHAAKLQRFQDMIDYHISKGSQPVLNMLNTKYIISPEGVAQQNNNALGNAWFVNNLKTVQNANEEIEALGTGFEPSNTAIVHKEFSDYISGLSPNKSGSIELTSYKPNELVYQSNTSSEQFAVFSDVWYGPNKGWQAYVDDQPVDHIRTNYLLRGMKIPSGNHTIKFEFKPSTFATGEMISYLCSGLILLGFLFTSGRGLKNWYEELPAEDIAQPEKKSVEKQTVKKTISKKKKKK